MLKAVELTKSYARRTVVDRVSISVRAGQILGLLGQSGAGKTTTLDMIAGLTSPDEGEVSVDGERITKLPWNARRKKRLGHHVAKSAFQKKYFARRKTVAETILSQLRGMNPYPPLGRKLSHVEADKIKEEALQQFNLGDVAESFPEYLSGGEWRRYSLALCLLHQPRIVLLDEPFSGMAPHVITILQQILLRLKNDDVSIVLVDQNFERVLEIADCVSVIHNGTIISSGTPQAIQQDFDANLNFFDAEGLAKQHFDNLERHAGNSKSESGWPVLRLSGIVKDYPGKRVLDGIDASVGDGKLVGLLGPNGAGKTTLFKIAMGFTKPSQGSVLFKNQDVVPVPPWHRAQLKMAMMQQDDSVFGALSVKENVLLALSMQGKLNKRQKLDRTTELLDSLGLSRHQVQRATTLSGGERRRLELAMCLALKPKVLLLDEPFTGIDPVTIHSIQDYLRNLVNDGTTIFLTDHRERETLTIVDYSYIICAGEIIVSGDAETVLNDEMAQEKYFGRRFDATTIIESSRSFNLRTD